FSSYVRDTPNEAVTRQTLTSFYSKARCQIVNNGGMLYQFLGDGVIALFGLHEKRSHFVQRAVETARALIDIGDSISDHWQGRIERMQTSGGLHIGMALGDLQIVALRPFNPSFVGTLADVINMAARLMGEASSGEIVASNCFYRALPQSTQTYFHEMGPV